MAEKRVSVRFASQGGDSLKAEMRGLGLAGREAMSSIGTAAAPAEQGLENISAAALKARMDLEQMATKAAAEAAKMRTTIPAASDLQARVMSTTGVTNASGMSAAETLQYGQALDSLRAKINPLYAEIRAYKNAVSEVRAAELEGAISANEAAAAKARLRTAALQAIDGIKGITAANREAARAADEAARAAAREAQTLDDLRARYNPVYAATRQYRAALADLNMLKAQGVVSSQEYSAALEREAERMRMNIIGTSAAIEQMSRASRGGALRMQQMFYQVNDIGVSLAGGMNPFLVMMQQGTQIAQIYGFGNGGVGGIFRDLGKMIRGVALANPYLTAAVVATGAAVAGLTYEINQTTDVAVGLGDTFLAVFQVIGRGVYDYIKPAVDMISPWFATAWDAVVLGTKTYYNALINGTKIAVDGIGTAVGTIPDLFLAGFSMAVSHAASKLHDLVWLVAQAVNGIAQTFNDTFGTSLGTDSMAGIIKTLDDKSGEYMRSSGAAMNRVGDAWSDFGARSAETWNNDPMGDFFDAVREQAIKNAKDREAKDKKGKKGGSKKTEKDEAADLIKTLQQELAVLRETDPVKKKMLEYSEQLADATDEQRAKVLDLVKTLDGAKNGWEAVGRSLMEYAEDAKRVGKDIGDALVSGFGAAEDAIVEFAQTGKFSFSDFASSVISDLLRISVRSAITGPLAGLLGSALGGLPGAAAGGALTSFISALTSFDGGGHTGNAPRSGGLDGKGGFLAMMHPRERVYDETRGGSRSGLSMKIINNSGLQVREREEIGPGGERIPVLEFSDAVDQAISRPGSAANRRLRNRGLATPRVRR